MSFDLGFLSAYTTVFFLIFARIGTMVMLVPALGERGIPVRIRLTLALMLSLVLYPIGQGEYPAEDLGKLLPLLKLVTGELLIGFFVGLAMRILAYALQTAGALIANQSGLAFAMGGDITNSGQQGALLGSFLALLGTTLIFASNMHHIIIMGLGDSFYLFPPGQGLPTGDLAKVAIMTTTHVFSIAVRLGAPFILFGLVFYFGLGLLNKLMPQLQIFFLAMPVNIMIGFGLLMLLLVTMMGWYMSEFRQALELFVVG
ncbi:flagellar biosynthetic protein FliR [Polycladidibacter stylochi]|uniref:flagellar biosynthetic protein FliR n=1 Tax=Polycladidibacter stylochi TaxID=1807766 RepID=UPI000833EEA5|nr:flagellar biosynthetic protein FliR [Pseudovibrio stylochi]